MSDQIANQTPWILELIVDSLARTICVSPFCTTCGAMAFRRSVVDAAARHAGEEATSAGSPLRYSPRAIEEVCRSLALLDDFAPDRALADLQGRGVTSIGCYEFNQALRVILIDLERASFPFGFDEMLSSSWAGRYLEGMREHARIVEERREERERYVSTEAAAERRAARRAAAEVRHHERVNQYGKRNQARMRFLDEMAALDPSERLRLLIRENSPFPFEAIPEDLVPVSTAILEQLSEDERRRLISKIDHRPGHWRRLAKLLKEST